MTDSTSNSTWGSFTPVMPAFIRLLAGVIVLAVVEAIVLGFPGITGNVSGTSVTYASLSAFFVGLIVALIVLKFGTQLAKAVSEMHKGYKTWTPFLVYFFEIVAILIVYYVGNPLAASYFTSFPWAYALIFLLIALVPTLKVVVNLVHAVEGHPATAKQHPDST